MAKRNLDDEVRAEFLAAYKEQLLLEYSYYIDRAISLIKKDNAKMTYRKLYRLPKRLAFIMLKINTK